MADIDIFNVQPTVVSKDLASKYILIYGKPNFGPHRSNSVLRMK